MTLMNDLFVRGEPFNGETGEKTGAQLEDLVTRAYPAASSQLVDQVTIESYSDANVTDDDGNAINRFRVKAGSLNATHFADLACLGPKLTIASGDFTVSQITGLSDFTNALDNNDATWTDEGSLTASKNGYIYADLGAAYIGYLRLLVSLKCNDAANFYVKCGYDSVTAFATQYGGNALQGDTPGTTYSSFGFLVPIVGRYPAIQLVTGGDDTANIKIARFDVHGIAV